MNRLWLVLLLLTASSCSTGRLQPHVNNLVVSQRPAQALEALAKAPPTSYGKRNELLYWLDKGMAAHLAGRYNESIAAFSAADKKFDQLYTRSISQAAASWAFNDYAQDYRGDDHEYVLVSVFQAVNFAVQGNIEEALVEARRVDQKLKLIGGRYKAGQKNVYNDDAFVRFFSGVLWQATGTSEGLNDAYIAYSRALKIYDFPPPLLHRNWTEAKAFMDEGRRPTAAKAHVYVIEYTGFAPIKDEEWILVPVDPTHVTKFAIPRYLDRFSLVNSSIVSAVAGAQQQTQNTQLGQNIGVRAKEIMASRRAWYLTKGAARPLMKYAAEKVVETQVRQNYGDLAAGLLALAGNIFNIASERADVRSWQTLPNTIRIARLDLDPGSYDLFIEDQDQARVPVEKRGLGRVSLQAGETRFLVTRSYR